VIQSTIDCYSCPPNHTSSVPVRTYGTHWPVCTMYVILAYCKLNVEVHCPKQVYVEPPPSPLDMTLPAFAAEPWCPQQGARSYRLISAADAGAQQQTCLPPSLLTIDGTTDRRTDAQPLHRPCFAYYIL